MQTAELLRGQDFMIEDRTFHVPVVEKRVRTEGNWPDVDFSDAALTRLDDIEALIDTTNPDLLPFATSGGKLIIYRGLADAARNPARAAAYFDEVVSAMGEDKTEAFARLYLVPGMFHVLAAMDRASSTCIHRYGLGRERKSSTNDNRL